MKEEPAATGRGARRRDTPLSILGFKMGAVVAGGGGVVAWGSPEKKLGTGGPRGMAGAAADRRWGVFSGRVGRHTAGRGRRGVAVWPVVAGSSGGWRLKMNRMPLISYPAAGKPNRALLLHEQQILLSLEPLQLLPEMLLHDQLPWLSHALLLWALLLLLLFCYYCVQFRQ